MTAAAIQAATYHPAWQSLSTFVWAAVVLLVVLVFRRDITELVRLVSRRVRLGSGIKLGSFEIGHAYVAPGVGAAQDAAAIVRKDSGARHAQRERYYVPNRNIQLVHRITPSTKPNQLYDILIYLVAHPGTDASLAAVKQVEYYFGKSWGQGVFTSVDRARGFGIATSAYGPFMCTAELHFADGEKVMINRYIDFEMGAVGPAPEPPGRPAEGKGSKR